MKLRAETNNAFLLKYLIIGLICTCFGLWATYDAFVLYPSKLPISQAWEELQKDKSLDDAAKDVKYKEMAQERGWPVKHPSKDESVEKLHSLIIWQYIFMAIGFGVGLPLLVWYLRNKGTWIELNGEEVSSSWGQSFQFQQIQVFDKKKWDKKGIGVVRYSQANAEKKFIIDDLKYDRKTTDEIVRIMELSLKPEQIINGVPEIALTPEPMDEESELESESESKT
jgi:hypothetical protein